MYQILWYSLLLWTFVHSLTLEEKTLLESSINALIPPDIRGSGPCDFQSPCTRGDWIGAAVRLSFHDAAGFQNANGCIDPEEKDHTGLSEIMGELETIYQIYSSKLSRADFWVLAANVAIKEAGGPDIGFKWGRQDLADCAGKDAGLLPDAKEGYDEVVRVFITRLKLTPRETVALMGAHTLGRLETANSGFNGPWVRHADEFSNEFFTGYEGVRWRQANDGFHFTGGNNLVMINTDVCLLFDPLAADCGSFGGTGGGGRNECGVEHENSATAAIVREYALDNAVFLSDFALAFQKLQEVGYSDGALCSLGSTSCTYTPPVIQNPEVTLALVDTIKSSVLGLLPDTVQGSCVSCDRGDFVGAIIRLIFHDAAGNGGPNGCLDGCTTTGCNGQTDHTGLSMIMGQLEPVYQLFSTQISRADFWVLAANAVLEAIGGPRVEFKWGRQDVTNCDDTGFMPENDGDWNHIKSILVGRMGFTIKELVALMGAHTLGRLELSNSGFTGPWTRDQDSLGVDYYSNIPGINWNKEVNSEGNTQWTGGNGLSMLNPDMALYIGVAECTRFGNGNVGGSCPINAEASGFVDEYAASQSTWFRDFALAFQKLQEVGYSNLKSIGGIPNCPSENGWLETEPGETASQTCPPSTSGEWTRLCDSIGTWLSAIDGCKVDPTCTDGIQNQGEEDIDCGGTNTGCPLCSVLFCDSVQCTAKGVCNEAAKKCDCSDGYSGERCEIPPVDPCVDVKCSSHSLGCVSGICQCTGGYTGNTCDVAPIPTCSDGVRNQDELAVDCGGNTCPQCEGYSWLISEWTNCSKPCGGGKQSRTITCLDTAGKSVHIDFCDESELHSVPSTQNCNEEECAVYSWVPGEWELKCSATCGQGTHIRTVSCVSSLGGTVGDEFCDSTNKPPTSETCTATVEVCASGQQTRWSGKWSECSTTCGSGTQTWISECVNISTSLSVDDSLCIADEKITDSRSCNTEPCRVFRWIACPLDACTAQCGGSTGMLGQQHRDVYCMDLDGEIADPVLCPGQKPITFISGCNSDSCDGPNWMADGPWSKCVDGKRERTYHCHEKSGANALDEVCVSAPLPVAASNWFTSLKGSPRAEKSCIIDVCASSITSPTDTNYSIKFHSTMVIANIISIAGLLYLL